MTTTDKIKSTWHGYPVSMGITNGKPWLTVQVNGKTSVYGPNDTVRFADGGQITAVEIVTVVALLDPAIDFDGNEVVRSFRSASTVSIN